MPFFKRHPKAFLYLLNTGFLVLSLVCINYIAVAQKRPSTVSVAFLNANNALPFSRFGGLFVGPIHPGLEFGVSRNWSTKKRHDWFQTVKLTYFYHRYVQHGIPLYTELGYRYKVNPRLSAEAALGAGYMHSIAATSVFALDEDGQYKRSKRGGRAQANGTCRFELGYVCNPDKSVKLFLAWQQRVQLPFIRSYVPVLPYNNLIVGVSLPFKKNKTVE